MVASNVSIKGIQQSPTTSKELTFYFSLSFRSDTSWEKKMKLKIHRIKIRNWDLDRIVKPIFIYGKNVIGIVIFEIFIL